MLRDTSYALRLLQHAQQLYSFAVNAQGGNMTYQTSVPTIKNSYPSSAYTDDLTMAALWLGLAQNDSTLVNQAQGYYNQFNLSAELPDSVFGWDSVLPGIPILATQIHQSYPHLGQGGWQFEAEMYLDRLVLAYTAGQLTSGSIIPVSQGKVLMEWCRWIAFLPTTVTIAELKSSTQCCHAVDEICYDCNNYH
jgi:endoglucanase